MENTDMIFEDANRIIAQELSLLTPEHRSRIMSGKRLRSLFLDHSIDGLDSTCVDNIAKRITKSI